MDSEEKLKQILDWCNAYPTDVFEPVSPEAWKEFHKVLKDNGMSGTAFAAECMRHVLTGIKRIIESEE